MKHCITTLALACLLTSGGATAGDLVWYGGASAAGTIRHLSSSGNGLKELPATTASTPPDWAAMGDVNGDGRPDLVWYQYENGKGNLYVRLGMADGSFSGTQLWKSGWGRPDFAALGDVNGDGKADLVWYEAWNSGKIHVLLSSGNGFIDAGYWASGWQKPDWAALADTNGDGKADLIWYRTADNGTVRVALSSDSSFGTATAWYAGLGKPDFAAAADLTGDRKADLLWYEHWNQGRTHVFASSGSSFVDKGNWISGWGKPDFAALADVTGDGKADLLWFEGWNSGRLHVMASTGTGFAEQGNWLSGWSKPDFAAATSTAANYGSNLPMTTDAANKAHLTQFWSQLYNSDGPNSSWNCGPTSLAMAVSAIGRMPAGLSQNQRIRYMRALINPSYARTYVSVNGQSIPQLALSENGNNLVGSDFSQIANAVKTLGGSTSYVYNQAQLDQALAAGQPVILAGYIDAGWRANFTAYRNLGYYGSGEIGHFNVVLGKTTDGRYLMDDPMFTGGSVPMTYTQLQTFTESGVAVLGLAIRF